MYVDTTDGIEDNVDDGWMMRTIASKGNKYSQKSVIIVCSAEWTAWGVGSAPATVAALRCIEVEAGVII